jgi:hypothetical protein
MAGLEPDLGPAAVCDPFDHLRWFSRHDRVYRSLVRHTEGPEDLISTIDKTFIAAPPKQLVLEDGFRFAHGQTIAPFTIVYETFGELNADKSNAILVCHALSASAQVAGKRSESADDRPGWWDTGRPSISTSTSSSA